MPVNPPPSPLPLPGRISDGRNSWNEKNRTCWFSQRNRTFPDPPIFAAWTSCENHRRQIWRKPIFATKAVSLFPHRGPVLTVPPSLGSNYELKVPWFKICWKILTQPKQQCQFVSFNVCRHPAWRIFYLLNSCYSLTCEVNELSSSASLIDIVYANCEKKVIS